MQKTRIMYIEDKSGGIVGPARIGRVHWSNSGRSIRYGGRTFRSLHGGGFKSNYADTETGEEFWISGCRRDGHDALYNTDVEIDEDAREEYWTEIRGLPDQRHVARLRCRGKY